MRTNAKVSRFQEEEEEDHNRREALQLMTDRRKNPNGREEEAKKSWLCIGGHTSEKKKCHSSFCQEKFNNATCVLTKQGAVAAGETYFLLSGGGVS